jgi:maltooligosyltrehalose trehalohydrolase
MLSASFKEDHWQFRVWAPEKEEMLLHVVAPFNTEFTMQKNEQGYFTVDVSTEEKNLQYFFKPGGKKDFPDPASQHQPQGVHGPSQTINHSAYKWNDSNWNGLPLHELILYELHVGLFTPEGTFEAIIPRLDELKAVGINALELMPVTQFPGDRNWGYDGVYPYAVQNSYGGPQGLKKLVDACHQKGIAVFLDVVYNHLGPEGNYFREYGPYFTNQYCTPWGDALNYDGEWSDGVRDFFSDNAIYWFEHYHIDGLRCDAIHAVFDNGAVHFWELVHQKKTELEQKTGKQFHLIAESDLNSPKVVKTPDQGGYGFDAQWLDDFHHALDVFIIPRDRKRYYDFETIEQVAKAYSDGFVHSGEWVKFRKRKHGASSAGVPGNKFIVFNQNHDQVGNRADGRRLCMLVNFERVKLAAAVILLSPYIPMLFMGEEYADDSPFFYFVSHSDEELIKAVQQGRQKEFQEFGFDGNVPDPQDEHTFLQSKICWGKRKEAHHPIILRWHQKLIQLRKELAPLQNFEKKDLHVQVLNDKALALFRHTPGMEEQLVCLFNFSKEEVPFQLPAEKNGRKLIDSKDSEWAFDDEIRGHSTNLRSGEMLTLQPLSVVAYAI